MSSPIAQSVLHPASGSSAELLHQLGLVLYVGAALVFVLVMTLAIRAVFSPARSINVNRWVIGGGIIFPVVTLSVLLIYSLAVGASLSRIDVPSGIRLLLDCFTGPRLQSDLWNASTPLRVEVVGKQWWWEVRYSAESDPQPLVLANEVHIPVGQPVEISLTTSDVIHSFWVPSVAGKVDMIPGRRNRLIVRTSAPGRFRGQCAEYCGGQHALMAFDFVVHPRDEFETWLARERAPAAEPTDPFLLRGYRAFLRGKCAECHTVRGTQARGTAGPDLTHVGSRRTLAAGVLDNHAGTMAGWIAGTHEAKPGSLMPATEIYTGEELRAVSAWLMSLK